MNRKIKFRAWSKKEKFFANSLKNGRYRRLLGQEIEICLENPKDYVLMQFTGLKDKNGKEIYEGDIVLFSPYGKNEKYEVYFKEDIAGFKPFSADYSEICLSGEAVEVIGNIYENPELIKKQLK